MDSCKISRLGSDRVEPNETGASILFSVN